MATDAPRPDSGNTVSASENDSGIGLSTLTSYLFRGLVIVSLIAMLTTPAAAQNDQISQKDICQETYIGNVANLIIQLSIYGGLIGMAVMYFGTTAIEPWDVIESDQESQLKRMRKSALWGGAKLVLGGGLLGLLLNTSQLPWASCVNLTPFM